MIPESIIILTIIVFISFDQTHFMQSMIHQPIFSGQIMGLLVGNYILGLEFGIVAQLLTLGYIPVGGAKIPDFQMASNLLILFLAENPASIDFVGLYVPVLILISIFFMVLTHLERLISTYYMKYIPYQFLKVQYIISASIFFHFFLFFLSAYFLHENFPFINKILVDNFLVFSGKSVYIFVVFYSLGNLLIKYKKWWKYENH
jgi:mannose/fructose/N-acetylgalactosamine-specific phosphotransferase system component IIC